MQLILIIVRDGHAKVPPPHRLPRVPENRPSRWIVPGPAQEVPPSQAASASDRDCADTAGKSADWRIWLRERRIFPYRPVSPIKALTSAITWVATAGRPKDRSLHS